MTENNSCIIIDGKMIPVAPPDPGAITPPDSGGPELTYTDKFIWGVAWVTNSVRVEWLFDGNADSYNVYLKGSPTNLLLSNVTESYYIHSAGEPVDIYIVEAIRGGLVIDSLEIYVDPSLSDCNMILYGTLVSMQCLPVEGQEVFIYTETMAPEKTPRTLLSKLRVRTTTNENGKFYFYIQRGLKISISIPHSFARKTVTLPVNTPVINILDFAGLGV